MPTGVYQHKYNANSARKLEDIAEGIDLLQRRDYGCADSDCRVVYVGGKRVQPHKCPNATSIIVRDGKEVWLCEKHFEKACDKLQETLREGTDLRGFYERYELYNE